MVEHPRGCADDDRESRLATITDNASAGVVRTPKRQSTTGRDQQQNRGEQGNRSDHMSGDPWTYESRMRAHDDDTFAPLCEIRRGKPYRVMPISPGRGGHFPSRQSTPVSTRALPDRILLELETGVCAIHSKPNVWRGGTEDETEETEITLVDTLGIRRLQTFRGVRRRRIHCTSARVSRKRERPRAGRRLPRLPSLRLPSPPSVAWRRSLAWCSAARRATCSW